MIAKGNYRLLRSTLLLGLLAGCAPLSTTEHGKGSAGGVPYVLPTSVMAVEIEVLRGENQQLRDLRFKLTPKLIPDPESGIYYLSSNKNALFQSDHGIAVRNGLLSSIDAVDVGTSGDVFLSVINSGINLYKFREVSAVAQSELDNPFLTASPVPTAQEIQAVLGLIQGDKMAFNYAPDRGLSRQDLPGTGGILFLRSKTGRLHLGAKGDGGQEKGLRDRIAELERQLATKHKEGPGPNICESTDIVYDADPFYKSCKFGCPEAGAPRSGHQGVLTRLLEPRAAELRLCLAGENLKDKRIMELRIASREEKKSRSRLEKTKVEQVAERTRACGTNPTNTQRERRALRDNLSQQLDSLSKLKLNEITATRLNALTSRMDDVKQQLAEVKSKIELCDAQVKAIAGTTAAIDSANKKLCELADLTQKNGGTPSVEAKKCPDDDEVAGDSGSKETEDGSCFLCDSYPIKQNSDVVLIAKRDILRVPIWRAGFGETENRLSFEDGILTGFNSKHPSTAQVAASSVQAALSGLVSLPAELVQLKVDLTNKETALAQGQQELESALDQLSEEVRRQRDIETEIELLRAELSLAQTRAEVTAGLGSVDSVAQRATLEERIRLLNQQQLAAGAQVSLDEQLSELSGTRAETSRLEDEIALLQQQIARREQEQALVGEDPEVTRLNRETALLNATRARREAELELQRVEQQLRELEASAGEG